MANMTILEAAEFLGVSKEAIHNRVRRGSLSVTVVDGVKMVNLDADVKKTSQTKPRANTRRSNVSSDDRYYKFLEDQNAQLQQKVEKLEGETKSLRDQKEEMLIREKEKIEQIYKEKDEQLKNFFNTISSQFMLQAPPKQEDHLDAEIEIAGDEEKVEKNEKKEVKGELISLKKYLKKHKYSEKKKEKVQKRFRENTDKDERVIVIGNKFYMDTIKYDYRDLVK